MNSYLKHNIFWYEDENNVYLTPDIDSLNADKITVNYENNDHSKILICCLDSYRLSLNLKYPIKSISSIIGKQIVLEKEKNELWNDLTIDKNNKVKTNLQSLNVECCYEVEELSVENLDLSDDLEKL